MKMTKGNKKYYKVLFVAILTIICFVWSIKMPYKFGPDEEMKMDICQYIYKNEKLPKGNDETVRDETWGISYSFTPILDYMVSAVFMKGVSIISTDSQVLLVAARLPSVLSYMGILILGIKISNKLFKNNYLKWLFLILIGCLPQLMFLGSYINNDCFALFCISLIIYSWILGLEKKWNILSCILLGIGIGLCSLSYYNAYGYILSSILIFVISFYKNQKEKFLKKDFFKKAIIISLIAFSIGGWWFIRSAQLNNGDFLGLKTTDEYGEKYGVGKYRPSARITPYKQSQNIFQMLFWDFWIWQTVRSFIGVFGNMTVIFPLPFYIFYISIYLTGIVGIILKKKGDKKLLTQKNELDQSKIKNKKLLVKILILNIIIPIILSMYYSYYSDFQAQGRYIMPSLIPIMYFFTKGIGYLTIRIFKKEEKIQIALKILSGILAILGVGTVIYAIINCNTIK